MLYARTRSKRLDLQTGSCPPAVWDTVLSYDLRTWPEGGLLRFPREDVLKLFPDPNGEIKGEPIEELGTSNPLFPEARGSAPAPNARQPRMSDKDMKTKLPTFLQELQVKSQQNRERFNQVFAWAEAIDHFKRQIDRGEFRKIYNANGLQQPVGRPPRNKTPPKS